ncbi:dentin sialophosphoprotein-like [Haliotis cracherodii]|uniref:dentin sialophosphoprotein-like n=1 Tax=Haliotis cracherodii TaxID=6455 RepID=UPI0039EC8DCF
MALDSNVTQSIPQEDAAISSHIEQKPHPITLKKVEDEDDAVIVFAHKDSSEALKVKDDLRRLKLKNGVCPRICLYDCEKFSCSLIKSPVLLVKNCKLIFFLLSNNFEHDRNCEFVLEEILAATRLEKDNSDLKKYCVRPLHTQPREVRNYETPCGLKAIRSFDLQNEYDRGKLLDLFNYNRGLEETFHCSVEQGDLGKAPEEDQSHSVLAETSLVNDYTTIGPQSMSAPPSAMTYGSKPPKQTPGAHTDRRTFSKETPNDNDINQGPDSMEALYGSESLKKGMYTGIGEPLEPQDGVPFIDDTCTVNDPCPNLSYSMGSLCMDGKRSVIQRNGYCKSLAPLLRETDLGNSLERDTRDPTDGGASGPDQTHVQSGCPSGDAADQGGNKTDKSDTNQKTSDGTGPVGSFVCSPSSNEHHVNTSNAPKPEDGEKAETSFIGDSEDIKPQKTSSISTNTTDMVREVQRSGTRDPKIQPCPHVGSASTFQGAESSPNLSSSKDEVPPTYEGTERKLGVVGASKEFPIDSSCAYITEEVGDTITQPVMKTSGPGHLLAPLCSSPSSEDTVLFGGPHSTKGDDHKPPKAPAQEEPRRKPHEPRPQLPHADDVTVSQDHIVQAAQFGGTHSSATFVFINNSSHIELSGDIHLVNVNAKTEFKEGNNSDKPSHQPKKKKKKHGNKLLTSGFEQAGSSGSSKSSSPSSTLKMSSIEMPPGTSPETASVDEVTQGSELVESKGDTEEPLPCQRDVMEGEEDAGEPSSAVDTMEMKKEDKNSDLCLSEIGCGEDCADDKSDSSEDEMKQKSKRKNPCFPFSFKRWRRKKKK